MTQYTSGKIPFAPNSTAHKTPSHKTPNPGPSAAQRVPAKASPQYPPSESIYLPEPPTDSEDEDSDADMIPVANWAHGQELNAALGAQETWQADDIFGPVPPFVIEDAFKEDKKIKKFRERTSSANWGGPDGLTQDEIARDMAARRIMRANGGWSYNVS
jgi:Inner centromere protein, ARK binding region